MPNEMKIVIDGYNEVVKEIQDMKANGDMHAALDYATSIKHKHKNFITEQGIDALY